MRVVLVAFVAGTLAAVLSACGGSDTASGPPVVDGEVLGDSLAVTAQRDLEDRGVFSASVGQQGGSCRGRDARWSCVLEIVVTSSGSVNDRRTYEMSVSRKACWVARQTGTDVGETGVEHRPDHPQVLKGCVK